MQRVLQKLGCFFYLLFFIKMADKFSEQISKGWAAGKLTATYCGFSIFECCQMLFLNDLKFYKIAVKNFDASGSYVHCWGRGTNIYRQKSL
jgi:hypothetical protein